MKRFPPLNPAGARVLKLDSIDAGATDSEWIGRRIAVKLRCCETGKLDGTFDVWVSLNISAAEALAAVLKTAADKAKQ